METILEFFEPTNGFSIWIGKVILISIIPYFVVWLLALILVWVGWKFGGDNQLRVYFGWILPLVLHIMTAGVVTILTSFHFKQLDISLGYSTPYILLILISGKCVYTLNTKVKERIKKLGGRVKE